jgi:hypothetical protein
MVVRYSRMKWAKVRVNHIGFHQSVLYHFVYTVQRAINQGRSQRNDWRDRSPSKNFKIWRGCSFNSFQKPKITFFLWWSPSKSVNPSPLKIFLWTSLVAFGNYSPNLGSAEYLDNPLHISSGIKINNETNRKFGQIRILSEYYTFLLDVSSLQFFRHLLYCMETYYS